MRVLSSSDVWLDAFHRQATSGLIVLGRRHALWCLHTYRLPAAPGDDLELVNKALGDIFAGAVTWDPTRASLLDQVCDVIRYRVRDAKRSASSQRHHLSIGPQPANGERFDNEVSGQRLEAEIAEALADEPNDPEAHLQRKQRRALGARIGAELAELAVDDELVATMVTCYRAGVCTRAEILAETGMAPEAYHDARRRLLRLVKRLGLELLAKADEELELST